MVIVFCWFQVYYASINTGPGPPDLLNISCVNDDITGKVVYKYIYAYNDGGIYKQPLDYEARELIYGDLAQNLKIDGTGDCYDVFITFRLICEG